MVRLGNEEMGILIWIVWLGLLALLTTLLAIPQSREVFGQLTQAHPYLMGAAKFALLGTMGELLGGRIAAGRWRLRGIRLPQRILVWAFIGVVLAAVFPLFSTGTDGLLETGLLPGRGTAFFHAFWKSLWMNLLFGFELMVFHRLTDMLIDRGQLLMVWPVSTVFTEMDWRNMFRVVGASVLWFWIPAHTVTFLLPPTYRILAAAGLGIALGVILGFAKRRAEAPG